jgi:hypothetical protein
LYLDCDEFTGKLNETNPDGLTGEVNCSSEQTLADTIANIRGDDRDAAALLSSGGAGAMVASAVAVVGLVGVLFYAACHMLYCTKCQFMYIASLFGKSNSEKDISNWVSTKRWFP